MADYLFEYDKKSPRSIEEYAKRLIGKTFREVCSANVIKDSGAQYGTTKLLEEDNLNNKGGLGSLLEEQYFHYQCNDSPEPDFKEAGVELKVTPYKINNNRSISAKERLILTMIDYHSLIDEEFETSHLWKKARLILLIYYLHTTGQERLDHRIDYASLFTPPEEDLKIIRHDFEIIRDKVRAGKAHELSEGDTLYLGAATKSSSSYIRRSQPNSDEPAKPRAFSFKNSYMTYVLNNYIVPGQDTCEHILPRGEKTDFEQYVISKVDKYRDWTVKNLYVEFDMADNKKAKNLEALIAYRILGIKGNKAEEFIKANIVVKTIRIGNNGKIKENMSFPAFKFRELVQEEWEDSTFGNYLRETRFLFIVYKYDEQGELHLKGCQFWNMPYADLENDVRAVWEKTKRVLLDGLQVNIVNGRHMNNFPKASENRVSHVRPHAQNMNDTYELPDGSPFPKQCFWLNNTYILSQLKDSLKG